MARRAQPGVRPRLFRVPRAEAGSVEPGQAHLVERHLRRQGRRRPRAVALRAGALGVAARAEIALAPGAHSVLADPVAVVNEVARRQRVLRGQVHVAAVAVAHFPLVLVLVAAEARRHLRQDGPRLGVGDGAVAAHAVAVGHGDVLGVVEAEVLARDLGALADGCLAVAPQACSLVVRLGVAAAADGLGRQVQRTGVPRVLDAGVAHDAVDALVHVGPVGERP